MIIRDDFDATGDLPSAGLVPAVHAFFPFAAAGGKDVGGRTESGHAGPKVVRLPATSSSSCSKQLNRTAVDLVRPPTPGEGNLGFIELAINSRLRATGQP
jgi:hypothetical protein